MMTPSQFSVIAKLIRLRPGPNLDAVRLVLCDGLTQTAALGALGVPINMASRSAISKSVKRIAAARALCKIANAPSDLRPAD